MPLILVRKRNIQNIHNFGPFVCGCINIHGRETEQNCTQNRNHKLKITRFKSNSESNEEQQPDIEQVNFRLLNIEGLLVEFDDVQIKIEQLDTTENQEIER